MTGKQTGSALFARFGAENIPRIDASIAGFMEKKRNNAGQPFMCEMYEMLQEYVMRDGKRLRPLVLLASYTGYGRAGKIPDGIIDLASVLEIMHSFLLIQDDIIDRSPMRRGGKSLHVITGEKYSGVTINPLVGNDVALVLADVLFANCIEIISTIKLPADIKDVYLSIFAKTYEMTAWGQILDSLNSQPRTLYAGNEASMTISRMKTAYYTLYYPLVMGYILRGGGSQDEWHRIESFALPSGLAFQVRDDVLGVFGDVRNTGKPSDSDIHEGKLTFLVQETVNRLPGRDRKRFISLFTKKKKSQSDINRIREMMVKSGVLDIVQATQDKLIEQSSDALELLNINARGRELLRGLLDLLIRREK